MMIKDIIKRIVLDQAEEFQNNSALIPREVYSAVESLVDNKQVIILTGIRRCGKSTLMNLIRQQNSSNRYYINFDDDRLMPFDLSDFDRLIEVFFELYGEQDHFYFDEIQNIVGWERFIRRLHNAGKKIFITGSNANLLSQELGTHLTGRYIRVTLYPFSFQEFVLRSEHRELISKKNWTSAEIARLKKDFSEYKIMGGMPEYVESKQKKYLHELYESILYKDIIVRHKLTQEKSIKDIVYYLASNNTKLFSYNSLAKTAGLASANTVSNYCQFLENSYLCFSLSRFSYSVKKQIQVAKKIYFIDHALAESIAFRFSEERGRTLEGIVFLELKRRNYEIYFHQEKKECDFLVRDGYKISQAIQVCETLMEPLVKERELDGLMEAMSLYNLSEGLIITEDEEGSEIIEKDLKKYFIKILPCWKWVLMKINLYEKDESLELKKTIEEITSGKLGKNLQSVINRYVNLLAYNDHRKNSEYSKYVNDFLSQYIKYLDFKKNKGVEDFIKDFPVEYGTNVFELVMAKFFSDAGSKLHERLGGEGLPDLELTMNDKKYFIECVTSASSPLDQYFHLLPQFEEYYQQAKLIYEKYGDHSYIKKCFPFSMMKNKHKEIENYEAIKNWIAINVFTCMNFPEFVEDKKFNRLDEIGCTTFLPGNAKDDFYFSDILAKQVAQAMEEKLKKKYCSQSVPVILAISLSLTCNGQMICGAENLIQAIKNRLTTKLFEILSEESKNNLKNLYAVLIDTSWYNWFPGIETNMPSGYNNTFGIIYNTGKSDSLVCDQDILPNAIPYSFKLDFSALGK